MPKQNQLRRRKGKEYVRYYTRREQNNRNEDITSNKIGYEGM